MIFESTWPQSRTKAAYCTILWLLCTYALILCKQMLKMNRGLAQHCTLSLSDCQRTRNAAVHHLSILEWPPMLCFKWRMFAYWWALSDSWSHDRNLGNTSSIPLESLEPSELWASSLGHLKSPDLWTWTKFKVSVQQRQGFRLVDTPGIPSRHQAVRSCQNTKKH